MEKVTTNESKKTNRKKVYQMIYDTGRTSKQRIASQLELSLPTVAQILAELEAENLIEKNGNFESSGGRKPIAICPVKKSRVSIGVEITKHHLQMVCIDLFGSVIIEKRIKLLYENNDSYYQKMGDEVNDFVGTLKMAARRIMGVGIAIQGIISPDGQYVYYGKIMDSTDATLADFAKYINYPCILVHDAESAAKAELWFSKDIKDAFYLSLSKHLGSAFIVDGALHKGRGKGSSLLEHMIWQHNGRLCYCGKRGCLETYCSADALLGDMDADTFFERAHKDGTKEHGQWMKYIDTLSSAIENLHMLVDCEVILGGHLGPYITEEDLYELNRQAKLKCVFPEVQSYIKLGKCPASVVAIGAALFYTSAFLEQV